MRWLEDADNNLREFKVKGCGQREIIEKNGRLS
jgi:hypothetical protein